jgi:hypothetical protein
VLLGIGLQDRKPETVGGAVGDRAKPGVGAGIPEGDAWDANHRGRGREIPARAALGSGKSKKETLS